MDIELIIDDRERAIFENIENCFSTTSIFQNRGIISTKIERLDAGDYQIVSEENILAIIERKTLMDYAASLKDGRHDNKDKMIELRNNFEGLKIYYIVEGAYFPDLNKQYAGIPYKNIHASIKHLEIQDDIHVIRTNGANNTALELLFLCETYSKLEMKGASREDVLSNKLSDEDIDKRNLLNIWKSFKGISMNTARYYAAEFTLRQIIEGVEEDDLDVKINNRKITKTVKNSLMNYDANMLLSAFPQISKNSAFMILTAVNMVDLINPEIDNSEISIGKVKLGKKKIENIIRLTDIKL